MSQIPLGRDVLCSADRGASPQRYNRKYNAWCGNKQVFIPAAEVQQVFSRTGRHKNTKSWSGAEFQQVEVNPARPCCSPSLGQGGSKATLRAAQGPSPPAHTFLPRGSQTPRGSAAVWLSPSPPQPPQLALKPLSPQHGSAALTSVRLYLL